MTANKDSGGGCLLFIFMWIYKFFVNRRIRKQNRQSRGLQEYKNLTPELVFPHESLRDNILISGGDASERLRLSEQILGNCRAQRRAAVVLHVSNGGLENIIARNQLGIVVNQGNRCFDPFSSLGLQEIYYLFQETCKSKYEIKSAGRYIIQIIQELLTARNFHPYFANFANAPIYELADRIFQRLANGQITQDDANRLNSLLQMGQSECAKIDSFLGDMKSQINHIAATDPESAGAVSILSAIRNGEILCLDLKSPANAMLVEFIVNSLIIAMNRGYEFSLFIDDLAFANNELLKNTLIQKSNHNNIICSKDLYSLTGGKEDLFSTIAGVTDKTILFSHGSHLSCEKWSKFFGEYNKVDISNNINDGFSKSSKWGYSANLGQMMWDKREYKVKPEQINRLSRGEIFVYDNQTRSLIQTNIV